MRWRCLLVRMRLACTQGLRNVGAAGWLLSVENTLILPLRWRIKVSSFVFLFQVVLTSLATKEVSKKGRRCAEPASCPQTQCRLRVRRTVLCRRTEGTNVAGLRVESRSSAARESSMWSACISHSCLGQSRPAHLNSDPQNLGCVCPLPITTSDGDQLFWTA